jgi:thiamine transport system ATP-binding protein
MLILEKLLLRHGDWSLSADLTIPKGERVALIGPSGAGKSSLLAAIAGFFDPVEGRILWDDTDLANMIPGERPLSILFQDQNLFPHLTVAQNAGLGVCAGLRLTPEQNEEISVALERVGLADQADKKPGQLSGGQQSRAALARVLLRARPMLLLDEPFSALGPALKSEMLDLVAEIASSAGSTVLMVTHDPQDALVLCPQTILVAEGFAAPPAPTAELMNNPPPALAAYLGRQRS